MSNTITVESGGNEITIQAQGTQGPEGTTSDPTKVPLEGNPFFVRSLSDIAQFLNGTVYELPVNRYYFTTAIDFGTATIDLITTNGIYAFYGNNFNFITYTGTGSFITSSTTGISLDVDRLFMTSPLGTFINLSDGNSLLLEIPVFVSCLKCVELDSFAFCTIDRLAVVGCAEGFTLTDVGTVSSQATQFNDGPNLGGQLFEFYGASGERAFISNVDSRPESTESFIYIDSLYGGDVTINGGIHQLGGGDFFKSGSKDETDVMILLSDVKNVKSSSYNGHVIANDNTTETVITTQDVWVDLDLGALAAISSNTERWQLNDTTTGELEYTGNEVFSGEVDGSFSIMSTGAQNYELKYVIDRGAGYIDLDDIVMVPFAADSATGTFPTHIPLACETGDKIKAQVRNVDGVNNITITHFSAGPTLN